MSNPASISGVDLTTPQGRQILQDALDILYGLIQKAGGTAAGPTTFDELRVRMLTVLGTINVVPEDKPPANVNSRLVTPWLTGQRGRGEVWRFEDQNDGGDLLEVRSQPYLIGTPTATAGDWEFRFYSAQRDPAGAYRSLGAIRFGSDGRIRTYDATEVLGFDSTVSGGLTSPVGPTDGGTGITTYATGDMLYAPTTNTLGKLAIGAANEVQRVNSTADAPEWVDLATALTDAGIDFTTGATTGRAPVTLEYSSRPGAATASYTPSEELPAGASWRVTVIGDATGGTAFIKYDGTTLTDNAGTNPICMTAIISRKSTTEVNCAGYFASDGGTTLETDEITSTSLTGTIDVSAGAGGTITSFIVERLGDTASGTAGGSGSAADAFWFPVPYWSIDSQDENYFTITSGNVEIWGASGSGGVTSGGFMNATSGNRPVRSGTGLTSQVDFDGTNDRLAVTAGPTTHQSGEFWIMFQMDALGGTLFSHSGSGGTTHYWDLYVHGNGGIYLYWQAGVPFAVYQLTTATGVISTGVTYVLRVASNGATMTASLDGVDQTVTMASGSNTGHWFADLTGNTFTIGAVTLSSGTAQFTDGKIYQIAYWGSTSTTVPDSRLLVPDQAKHMKRYLNDRWGISLPL